MTQGRNDTKQLNRQTSRTSAVSGSKNSGKQMRRTSTVSQIGKTSAQEKQHPSGCGIADWARVHENSSSSITQNGEIDPYHCSCRPCQKFWKQMFGAENADLLTGSPINRSRETGPMFYVKNLELKVGDRVLVWRTHKGVVKYIGTLADDLVSPDLFIGVQLDDNVHSLCNGMYQGKKYFNCTPGHGAFVKYQDIIVCEGVEEAPESSEIFPGHKKIVRERCQRRKQDPEYDIGTTFREERAKNPDLRQAKQTARLAPDGGLVYDKNDMAYKDYKRWENKPRPPSPKVVKLTDEEKLAIELKKQFGGGPRAEKMVETVQKLKQGYKDGLEIQAEESEYSG